MENQRGARIDHWSQQGHRARDGAFPTIRKTRIRCRFHFGSRLLITHSKPKCFLSPFPAIWFDLPDVSRQVLTRPHTIGATVRPCSFKTTLRSELCTSSVNWRAKRALTQFWCTGSGAYQSRLKQVDFATAVHLTSDEFEAGDLALGLSIRPRQDNCRPDSGFIPQNRSCADAMDRARPRQSRCLDQRADEDG